MNKRIKKKQKTMKRNQERKQLRKFVVTIKRLSRKLDYGAPPEPVVDEMKKALKILADNTCPKGFACSDVILDYHDNVVRGNIVLAPTIFPIDFKVIKNRIE